MRPGLRPSSGGRYLESLPGRRGTDVRKHPSRVFVLPSLRKAVVRVVLLAVLALAVHLLENHIPLCKCVADAVRSAAPYAWIHEAAHATDPLEAAASAASAVRGMLREPPALGDVVTPERRARVRAAAEDAARWVHEQTLPARPQPSASEERHP